MIKQKFHIPVLIIDHHLYAYDEEPEYYAKLMNILNEIEPQEIGLIGKPFTKDELLMEVERLCGKC